MEKKLSSKLSNIVLAGLCLITFLLYLKSLKVGFISDDFNLIFDYKTLINPLSGNRFLPIQGLYYFLINLLHFNPMPVKLVFLIFQFVNIFLVFKIVHLVTKNRSLSLLSTFIFTLFYRHPMAIYWLPGSLEILLLTFFLSSILFFILYRQDHRRISLVLSLIFFALALLSKESAIVLPFVLFLIDFLVFRRFRLKTHSHFIGLAIIYFLLLILTADQGTSLFLSRGGYHAINLDKSLVNYANILAAFLPLKFDQEIVLSVSISALVVAFVFISFFIFLFWKKIPRQISLFLGIILITTIPYAFFSPFGFQDKYLFLSSFAFSALLASLVWELKKKLDFRTQIALLLTFCFVWASLSLYLISHRSRQWQAADQITKEVQKEFAEYCSLLGPQTVGYLVNFPLFINNQVFIFNNTLRGMLRFSCKKEIGYFEEILGDPAVGSFLKNSQEVQEPSPNLFIFAYEDGAVKDYSNKYRYLENFFHARVTPSDLKTIFNRPEDWIISKTHPQNKLKIKKEAEALVLEYYIFAGGWVSIYHKNLPVIKGTLGFSIDVEGDAQGEIIHFDLLDKETGEYFRFSQKIDWTGWRTLKAPYASGQLVGQEIKLEDVDDLRISLDADREIQGQIKIRNLLPN